MLPPAPPYAEVCPVSPPPFSMGDRPPPTLVTLPPHLLLRIVYETFSKGEVIHQRKVLYWLTMSLRLVSRGLYVACMHILRSTYIPAYEALIRPPYTSDPFPLSLPDSPFAAYGSSAAPLSASVLPMQSMQRETRVFDLFIALKVREDVWADDSSLHLERKESFKDLFDLMQPRARLEDLVRAYGRRDGLVSVPSSSGVGATPLVASPSCDTKKGANGSVESFGKGRAQGRAASTALPFSALSVSFSPRAVGLVLTTSQRKKTIVQVPRTRVETLEDSARKLVRELRAWIAANPDHGVR
ncbi:hypothetical protein BD413DRAFT_469108 [Trametes elegans]|nr:hypothetical protein BD413DRAFT_469108 [Trametes elegans]